MSMYIHIYVYIYVWLQVVRPGKGQAARDGNVVSVKYKGRLDSGKRLGEEFDSGTIRFKIGGGKVIRGWDEGIPGMVLMEKRKLWVPTSLGYGNKGSPPQIPRNTDLVFDIQLTAILYWLSVLAVAKPNKNKQSQRRDNGNGNTIAQFSTN